MEHGLMGTNEAKLPVRANVTCRYVDKCASSTTAVVVTEIGCHPCPSASSSTQNTLYRSRKETNAEALTSIRQCGRKRVPQCDVEGEGVDSVRVENRHMNSV